MSKAETVFGLAILAFGGALLVESLKLPYFVEEVPGPGFLPFWLSLAIVAVGVILAVRGMGARRATTVSGGWPDIAGIRRIAITLAALAATLVFLESLGFFLCVILFVAAMTLALGSRSWRELVVIPLLAAAVLYGVFGVWLKVPLPTGIVRFLG